MEEFSGKINVKFDDLPLIKLKFVTPGENATLLERITLASKRRYFTLLKSWHVELKNVKYQNELNGILTIPKVVDGKPLVFDGASIPVPWFVSLITIGILRPMGVMLTASIIHDFVYKYGYLLVTKDSQAPKKVKIERHIADLLLKDIIGTFNRMPKIAYVGWFFVRVGWVFVKYNKRHFGGKPPIKELIIFAILFSVFTYLTYKFTWLTAFVLLGVYLGVYAITIIMGNFKKIVNSEYY